MHWTWLAGWYYWLTGARDETGRAYGFWSGFGGTVLFSAIVMSPLWYYHHTCHARALCLRWGRFEAAGGIFRTCHRHHPRLGGRRPDRELIRALHREWENRGR